MEGLDLTYELVDFAEEFDDVANLRKLRLHLLEQLVKCSHWEGRQDETRWYVERTAQECTELLLLIPKKEKAERLERLSTPLWKKKPVPSHSLTALLGDKNVFTPNIASRQSLLSSEASRLSSPIQNQQSVMSNHSTAGGRLSPASQLSGLEKPSLSSGHSRQHRRVSIDMTAKSNNVPLLQTFNKYKRKQTKRTKDEVQKLRDALKPKVTIVNEDGEKVEQIEEVMLIDQPSPRTLLTKANTWKAPFTDLHGTFYDSDLEDDEGEGEGEGSTSEQVRQLKYNLFAHYHSF